MRDPSLVLPVLAGTACGDAAGLPWEGLRADVVRRILDRGPRSPLGGRVSDDTEHSVLLVRAWARAGGDRERFRAELARGLRGWLLGLPPGIGLGTLRALVGSWLGRAEGVASEGNGAAMRAAALGVLVEDDALEAWVVAASRITHTSPAAVEGALVVARAAACGATHGRSRADHLGPVLASARDPRLRAHLALALACARDGSGADALAAAMGCPGFVTGWVSHTVPMAVHLWLVHDAVEPAVDAAVRQGGDTDSVAAITGALVGATARAAPEGLGDHPPAGRWLAAFAADVEAGRPPPGFVGPGWAARNLLSLAIFVGFALVRRAR